MIGWLGWCWVGLGVGFEVLIGLKCLFGPKGYFGNWRCFKWGQNGPRVNLVFCTGR